MAVVEGRQLATTLDEVRPDHVERYKFAARWIQAADLGPEPRILDAACGCGYGTQMLAEKTKGQVRGVDISGDAISHAQEYFAHPMVTYTMADIQHFTPTPRDVIVSFETIEHVAAANGLIRKFAGIAPRLICSVPNQEILPFDPARHEFHIRHYSPADLTDLLVSNGYRVREWWTQHDKGGTVVKGHDGMFLIAVATTF